MLRCLPLLCLCALLCAACHHIKADYPKYLAKHPASPALPHVPIQVRYEIDESTLKHRAVIRSGAAGYGNKWIVELGQMLQQTMQSADVRAAFAQLSHHASPPSHYDLRLELVDYQVSGFSAHLMLRAVLRQQGLIWIDKVYLADGPSQIGKVVWGGAFAMRNALHATTKHAVDLVLRQLLIDTQRVTRPPGAGAAPIASN